MYKVVKDKPGEKGIISCICQGEEFVFFKQIYHFMLILARKIKIKQTHTHKKPHLWKNIQETNKKKLRRGASLVAQWLRIRLPMQGTRVQALVREDPTCRGATKPVRHNY